jgi:hypothetical protein
LEPNVIRAATVSSRTEQQQLSKIAFVYLIKFLGFLVQVPVADAVDRAFFLEKPSAIESSADLHVKERLSGKDWDYLLKKTLDIGNNPPVGPFVPSVSSVPNPTASKWTDANPLRPSLACNSKLEKIRILASMYQSDKDFSPSSFSPSYKALYYSKVKPVGLCLAHCFDGDIARFDQELGQLPNKGKYICCSSTHHWLK